MSIFCKNLCERIAKNYCYNNFLKSYRNYNLYRLQYFSSFNNHLLYRCTMKSVIFSNKNQISSLVNLKNLSFDFTYNFTTKLKKYAYKLLLIESYKQTKKAIALYKTLQGIKYKEFFTILEMPDSFTSWFGVLELHIWMLLTRLQQDQNYKAKVRTALINLMWEDVQIRAKTHAPSNVNFKKNMKQYYNGFKMKLFSYDEAFLSDDKALASSLWCYFFNKNCDDPRKLEALVSFVRYQMDHLQFVNFNVDDIEKENINITIWKSFSEHLKHNHSF